MSTTATELRSSESSSKSKVQQAPKRTSRPDLILAAVVADRRRRDLERLQREDAVRRRLRAADPLSPSPWL